MINNGNDIGFIHDISGLDRLRQNAVEGTEGDEQAALSAAAKQFEAIFTSMLFKSMREANADFESDLMNSQNQSFYRQMLDEQMASEMSANGSLGLADMIVAQLSTGSIENPNAAAPQENFEEMMQRVQQDKKIYAQNRVEKEQAQAVADVKAVSKTTETQSNSFDSPESFVSAMQPYADRAAKALGVDSSVLIAQAALETGWGQKVIQNGRGSSNNLFNIKADRSWQGDKMATQTLEYHSGVPVQERAAFRSYDSFQQSFDDYVQFLERNPRYNTALQSHQGDSEAFMRGIHQAGYATDPKYVDKVMSVKRRIDQM
ncbi:flagellar assembly peptidoglycan hydrolase FlgJ [Vibrio astriarenae]|uniref:Peptidoglycan hydrolase FlgJ n=1 Tax=Vibrio astriarenae TaxID=1481923 RepID=A0A7Z2T4A5_9VIBR|nr:flagellar assembly peptidoglycan hydrolase FlgJ [Vibrio astriarenae]QIA63923.1 flagellar assembly peptidoglycan hydrolase FlgJ [Vibrio astriarenae]